MKHYESSVHHEGFSVHLWTDTMTRDVHQEWDPPWAGELVKDLTDSLTGIYQNFKENVVGAMTDLFKDLADEIANVLQAYME
jgi:hypothetical protein